MTTQNKPTIRLKPKAKVVHRINLLLRNSTDFYRRLNQMLDHAVKEELEKVCHDFYIAEKQEDLDVAVPLLTILLADEGDNLYRYTIREKDDAVLFSTVKAGYKFDEQSCELHVIIKAPLTSGEYKKMWSQVTVWQRAFIDGAPASTDGEEYHWLHPSIRSQVLSSAKDKLKVELYEELEKKLNANTATASEHYEYFKLMDEFPFRDFWQENTKEKFDAILDALRCFDIFRYHEQASKYYGRFVCAQWLRRNKGIDVDFMKYAGIDVMVKELVPEYQNMSEGDRNELFQIADFERRLREAKAAMML